MMSSIPPTVKTGSKVLDFAFLASCGDSTSIEKSGH